MRHVYGVLVGLFCLLGSCSVAAQSKTLLQQADSLAGLLRQLDELSTQVYLNGAGPKYLFAGKPNVRTSDTMRLTTPGRYQFIADSNRIMTVRVAYGDRDTFLRTTDTVVLLYGKERTDLYQPGQPGTLCTIEQFPDALYVLADYLEPGTDRGQELGALDRLLSNPFLESELGFWRDRQQTLYRALRTHQLKERRTARPDKTVQAVGSGSSIDLRVSDIPTAPERLQKASEDLYARQSGLSTGFNQTAIIRGLATFVEKRAQEELNIVFLERMHRKLSRTRLGILFPRTLDLFTRFELHDYRALLDNAYPYFQQDLREVGRNFPRLLRQDTALVSLRFNPNVLNAAHFLEMTSLALSGASLDSILQRAVTAYGTEEAEMDALMREIFLDQIQDSAFAKNTLGPLHRQVQRQQEWDRAMDSLLNDALVWGGPDRMVGQTDDPERRSLVIQAQQAGSALRDEAYFLEKDAPVDYHRFGQLYRAFRDQSRASLFVGASLADYDQYIRNERADSLFGAELLARAQQLLQPRTIRYAAAVMDGTYLQFAQIREAHRQALQLERRTLLARGMRVLQIRTFLERGLEQELQYWRQLPRKDLGADTLALRFFQEVLTSTQAQYRSDQIKTAFLGGPNLWSDEALLPDQLTQEEAFQDSVLHLLEPHLLRLKESAPAPRSPAAYREVGFLLDTWSDLIGRMEQIDPDSLRRAVREVDMSYLNQVDSLVAQARGQYDIIREAPSDGAPTLVDTYNPWVAQARAVQQIPPVKLPPAWRNLEKRLDSLQKVHWDMQRTWQSLQKQWEEVYTGGHKSEFYAAARNARHLRSVSEMARTLVEAFRVREVDSTEVMVRDTSQLLVRNSASGRVITQQIDTVRMRRLQVEERREWLSPEAFDSLLADPHRRRAFLGLLYQRLSAIEGLPFDPQTTGLLATQTVELVDAIRRVRQQAEYPADSLKENRIVRYLPVARGVLRLFSTVLNAPREAETLGQALGLDGVSDILENTLGTYEHLAQEQYGFALTAAMGMYQSFSEDEPRKKNRLDAYQLQSSVLTYGNFMADIAQAQTSGQVQAILSTYASQPGSSRLKRNSDVNLSLNAYLGPAYSRERPVDDVPGAITQTLPSLSTPVGLAFNWRWPRRRSHGEIAYLPFTVFFPILDIGPVVTFNFGDELLSSTPDLHLGDFLAPGLFLFYNLPRSPFTGGIGYQRTAEVRSVNPTGLERQDYRTDRFSVFLGIDVPIFNFFTKN